MKPLELRFFCTKPSTTKHAQWRIARQVWSTCVTGNYGQWKPSSLRQEEMVKMSPELTIIIISPACVSIIASYNSRWHAIHISHDSPRKDRCDTVRWILRTPQLHRMHSNIETETKWPTFCRRHFQMCFLESKSSYFDSNLTEVWSR